MSEEPKNDLRQKIDDLTRVVDNLQSEFKTMRVILVGVYVTIIAPLIIAFLTGGIGKK